MQVNQIRNKSLYPANYLVYLYFVCILPVLSG